MHFFYCHIKKANNWNFMTFHLVNYHIIFNKFAYLNRLPNGTFIGMIREIQDGLVDTSVAGFNWIPERSGIVDFTQGIFPNVNKIFIRRPTKKDISLKYFLLGNFLTEINYFAQVMKFAYFFSRIYY